MFGGMRLSTPSPKCTVVVPIYGDGCCLEMLVWRLDAAFMSHEWDPPEVILVDDCGSAKSWMVVRSICESRPSTLGIELMRNFGQHNALMCGFHYSNGDVVVTMDDDLQHGPESVPQLVKTLFENDLDLVYGVYDEKMHTRMKNLGSMVVIWFYRLVVSSSINITSFRVVDRKLVQAILRYDLNFTFVDGLLAWNTHKIGMAVVPHYPRKNGKSSYSIAKLFALAMNMFTNFSLLPLQIGSVIGFAAAASGVSLGLVYLCIALFFEITVTWYSSTITAVLILGGLQLLSLGIMGEYIGRLHLNVNRKPQFTIRTIYGAVDGGASSDKRLKS